MKASKRARCFCEFKGVLAVKMRGRATFTKFEEEQIRREFTIEALGQEKSWSNLTDGEVDKILGHCRSITEPGNLQAQLDALDGRKKRLRFGIIQTAREREVDVDALVYKMHTEAADPAKRKNANSRPLKHARFDQLDEDDLEKVRIAVGKHTRRAEKTVVAMLAVGMMGFTDEELEPF